ncbi:hypothetical protein WDU94_005865 [Cyamophila willieti]
MCKCCYTTPSPTTGPPTISLGGPGGPGGAGRQYTVDFEPAATQPFDDTWERKLSSVQQVKEEMHKFIAEQLSTSRVPLCINPQSAAFKSFASSSVAHPSELPPSPLQWE